MKSADKAYIAGFLDGDGSIIAQLVRRKDYKYGFQIRISVVFFQKTIREACLKRIQKELKAGYIRKRKDISDLTIVGFQEVKRVLKPLLPHLRIKNLLAKEVLDIIETHEQMEIISARKFISLCKMVDKTSLHNYSKNEAYIAQMLFPSLKTKVSP